MTRPRPHSPYTPMWLALAATLVVAIALALMAADHLLGAPQHDLELLAWFLTVSAVLSLALGALVIRWAGGRIGSVRRRLALAFGVGLLVALVNIVTTSALMFLSPHDLGLLLLLLVFAGVISVAFAYAVAGVLTNQIEALSAAANQLAEGDLSVRVGAHGRDEIGRLAAAFDAMAEQLEQAFGRERALEAGRRELITAVSHDLRTPLATTRAMVEALADNVVNEPADVQRYLGLILQETQHLSRLIDDLFELSQIDSGALRLQCLPIDIAELVAETVAAYQAPAAEGGIRLEEAVADAVESIRVQADPERLQRVLRNLLDNALRNSPRGGLVRVAAAMHVGAARMSVDDSGPGVPDDELERIFDRFYRGEPSRRREAPAGGGAGLGLAIARGLVQAHKGRIWAERSPLGGMSVRIELPA
ncbi:MAG: HAMP domain-containing protein [Chloroflexi bacterium]|nr:HAMP domain-containing protein [Chloroflexota bacterium]